MGKALFTCDGCGRQELGSFNGMDHFKPHGWYERTAHDERRDEGGKGIVRESVSVLACSRPCIARADAKRNESKPVLPV